MNLCSDRRDSYRRQNPALSPAWPDDWPVLVKTRANLLVTGPAAALEQFVVTARSMLREPILAVAGGTPLVLQPASTIIVRDVDKLDDGAQRLLLAWVNDPGHAGTQVVSTATAPLFPLVQANVFDPSLYYRLAVIWLQAEEPGRKSPSALAGN